LSITRACIALRLIRTVFAWQAAPRGDMPLNRSAAQAWAQGFPVDGNAFSNYATPYRCSSDQKTTKEKWFASILANIVKLVVISNY